MAQSRRWHLRPAQVADLPAMAALERVSFGRSAWTQAMLAEELAAPMRHYVVAEITPNPKQPSALQPAQSSSSPHQPTESSSSPHQPAQSPSALPQPTQPTPIAGFGGICLGEIADIMTIEVAPHCRTQGLGRAIMEDLCAAARAAACQAIMLEVKTDNAPAIALYQSLGFVTIGLRRRYYQPENADAHTMRLDLPHPDGCLDGITVEPVQGLVRRL